MFEIFILVTFVCGIASIRKPGIAIGLLICMFGIEDLLFTQSTHFLYNRSHVNYAVGIVAVMAALGSLSRLPLRLDELDRVQWLAFALYGLGFLSFIWGIGGGEFSRWRSSLPYIGVYLVLAPILTREENALRDGFMWSLVFGVPVIIAVSFFCEWGVRGLVLVRPIIENGFLVNETRPLALASLASTIAIIAMTSHLKFSGAFLFRIAVLAIATYLAFLTRSRGQVVAIIAVVAIVYPISNRVTNVKGLFLTTIGFVALGMIIYYIANTLDLTRWERHHVENAVLGRQEMWGDLLTYWIGEPGMAYVLGLGACASFEIIGWYPHNLPIEILVELGLVGFVLFCLILLVSFSNTVVLLSKLESHPKIRSTVVATVGLIGVNLALSMKQGSLYIWTPLFFYAICLSQQVAITGREMSKTSWKNLFFKPSPAPGPAQQVPQRMY